MKTFILFLKRLFGIAETSMSTMMDKADQKVDIEKFANQLLKEQREKIASILKERDKFLLDKNKLKHQLNEKKVRYNDIVRIIVLYSDKLDELDENTLQEYKSAVHEGTLLKGNLPKYEAHLAKIEETISSLFKFKHIAERNIMTIESRIETLKIENSMAEIKLTTYSKSDADKYFNLEKLEEIVATKQVKADTAQDIHAANNPQLLAENTIEEDEFVKQVLAEHSVKESKGKSDV